MTAPWQSSGRPEVPPPNSPETAQAPWQVYESDSSQADQVPAATQKGKANKKPRTEVSTESEEMEFEEVKSELKSEGMPGNKYQ